VSVLAAMPSEFDYAFALFATAVAIPFWIFHKVRSWFKGGS